MNYKLCVFATKSHLLLLIYCRVCILWHRQGNIYSVVIKLTSQTMNFDILARIPVHKIT